MYAAAGAQMLPAAALAVRWPGTRASRWVALAWLVSLAGDVVQFALADHGYNNLWVSYLTTPLLGAGLLWGLAWLQPEGVSRLAIRLSVPAYVVVAYLLALTVERLDSFSRWVFPLHSLLVMAAALWTLLNRGLRPQMRPLFRTDWLWMAGGLALYGAATLLLEPVLVVFMRSRLDLVLAAYNGRAAAYLIAFLAITWGVLCREPATRSGLSSSPAPLG